MQWISIDEVDGNPAAVLEPVGHPISGKVSGIARLDRHFCFKSSFGGVTVGGVVTVHPVGIEKVFMEKGDRGKAAAQRGGGRQESEKNEDASKDLSQ